MTGMLFLARHRHAEGIALRRFGGRKDLSLAARAFPAKVAIAFPLGNLQKQRDRAFSQFGGKRKYSRGITSSLVLVAGTRRLPQGRPPAP